MFELDLEVPVIPCSYYEVEELNNNLCEFSGTMIVHHNVRSFNRNFDNLALFLSNIKHSIDIIVLSETWFVEEMCVNVEGYVGHHVCRADKIGGGVSIYVRESLKCTYLSEYSKIGEYGEFCVVELSLNERNQFNSLTIIGTYRPPDTSFQLFSAYLSNILSELCNKTIVLCGDFNVELLTEEENADFFNSLYSYNLFPLITIATRISETSAKCIDQIWYNKLNVSFSGSFITDVTDHYPVFVVLHIINN